MTDSSNILPERYCPRWDSWVATRGPRETRPTDVCAECGAAVVYNPTHGEGPVRLVCIDCLRPEQR